MSNSKMKRGGPSCSSFPFPWPFSCGAYAKAALGQNPRRRKPVARIAAPPASPIARVALLLLEDGLRRHVDRRPRLESRSTIERSRARRRGLDGGPDVSTSMEAEDTGSSRIELAKQTSSASSTHWTATAWASSSSQGTPSYNAPSPLITERSLFLDGVTTTCPCKAQPWDVRLRCAPKGLTRSRQPPNGVVFTDGENHEDDAVAVAEDALDLGIEVHTAGMQYIRSPHPLVRSLWAAVVSKPTPTATPLSPHWTTRH